MASSRLGSFSRASLVTASLITASLAGSLLATVSAAQSTASTTHAPSSTRVDADALARRFIAPCCYNESLASHDSPLAHQLRDELRARVARGESSDAITEDLVARYGERVLAIPSGIEGTAFGVLSAIALAGVALGLAQKRRSRAIVLPPPAPAPTSTELDARLEKALAELDGADVS